VTCLVRKLTVGPGRAVSAGSASFLAAGFSFLRWLHPASSVLLLLLFATSCAGQSWQHVGPPGGNVTSLATAHGIVYLGTPDGHIFGSSNRGERWELRGRVSSRLDGVVQRIVADRGKRDRLLAAVWFQGATQGGALFESLDGGRHWSAAGLSGEAVRALEHSESDPRVWVAGTRSGVFRSVDDARSWQRISRADDPELQNIDSLAIDPTNPEIIYVGTYHLPWKTPDGGKTWSSIASGMIDDSDVMSLHIDAKNPRRIFSSACSGIYRSDDAGLSWTKLQGIPYASRRTQQIIEDARNPGTLYAATTQGLWRTSDYGENWKRITPRETVANAVIVLADERGARILVGMEEQGVLRSDDEANSFSDSNAGFSHRVIASIAADSRQPLHLLTRIIGFGGKLIETKDGGASWKEFPALPPKPAASLYSSSSGWWLSFADGGLARFDDQKGNWKIVEFREAAIPNRKSSSRARPRGRPAARARTVVPHVSSFLESSGKILVATDDGLWTSGQGESEFRRVAAKSLPRSIVYLSPGAQSALLAIAGNCVWTSDAGNTVVWNQFASPQTAGPLLWLREDSVNGIRMRILGTQNGVFATSEDGEWHLVSNGLPAIASEPLSVSGSVRLLAMSNGGIYQSVDIGKTWQRVDTDAERGGTIGMLPAPDHGFFLASKSEGLLRLPVTAPRKR
jgi:photosystem II stability/assembly factor-like uncharacterized protein